MDPTKPELQELVQTLRAYGTRIIADISPETLNWAPPNTTEKSAAALFRHIINAEIYWLEHLGDPSFAQLKADAPLQTCLGTYKELGVYLAKKIQDSSEGAMALRRPQFEGHRVKVQGSLGWMIWRTALHAVHHFAQIAYIRHTLGDPPAGGRADSWSQVMDKIAAVAHGTAP